MDQFTSLENCLASGFLHFNILQFKNCVFGKIVIKRTNKRIHSKDNIIH